MSARTRRKFDPAKQRADAIARQRLALDKSIVATSQLMLRCLGPLAVWEDEPGSVRVYGSTRPRPHWSPFACLVAALAGY